MSIPVYPGFGRRGDQGYTHPPSESEHSFEAAEMSSSHTGTPSLTDSMPEGSVARGYALQHPAAEPDLDPIPDADEFSDRASHYQDVESNPSRRGSRLASHTGSRPQSRAANPQQGYLLHDAQDPFAHDDEAGVRFQPPLAGHFSPAHGQQAMATGLLQQPRPALVRRSSSRNADRGHPFSVEHMPTEAEVDHAGDIHAADHQEPFFDPTWASFMQEGPLEMPFFDHVVQRYGEFGLGKKFRLAIRQFFSFCLTFGVLNVVLVTSIFQAMNPFAHRPPRSRADREYETRITGERGSGRVQYYCEVRPPQPLSFLLLCSIQQITDLGCVFTVLGLHL